MARNLKQTVSAYLKRHQLEEKINNIVNRLVRDRPDDPYEALGELFRVRLIFDKIQFINKRC